MMTTTKKRFAFCIYLLPSCRYIQDADDYVQNYNNTGEGDDGDDGGGDDDGPTF